MKQETFRWGAAAALALALACGGDGATGPDGRAELQVWHATPTLGPVDVIIGGRVAVTGLEAGRSSRIVRVAEGVQHVLVRSGTEVLGELDYDLTTVHLNSLVVADSAIQWSGEVIPDTGQAISNRANIRMINVVGGNLSDPTLLHIKVQAPGDPDSIVTFGMDAKVATHGSLTYWDPGHFTFTYVPQGSSTVLTEVQFDVAAGEKRAVVLERAADGTYSASVLVEQ